MPRSLSISLTLAVFLTATKAFAFDNQRVAAPTTGLQQIERSLGVMLPKDECWIWCDNLSGWVWIYSASWFGPGCGFYKYVDPYECYTDCLPPYFPFAIESMMIGVHVYDWPGIDYYDVVLYLDIHEAAEDLTHPCGFNLGAEIWRSNDLLYSLPPGWYGWLLIHFPIIWASNGPLVVSWHIVSVPELGYFGWLTDNTPYGTTPCWNWLDGTCTDDFNAEFYHELDWLDGNLLFGVGGRPKWNVAVDLGYFEAVPGDGMVTLNWQSLSEINNAKWIIERNAEKINEFAGQGNKVTATDYAYVDRDVANGITYSYTITAVNYDGNEDVYGPVTATPAPGGGGSVELSDVRATASNRAVTITWVTNSEFQNKGFEMYSRIEGEVFARINTTLIPGAGTSTTSHTYKYVDRDLTNGVTYYYKIASVSLEGYIWVYDVIVSATPLYSLPESFHLFQNYPNPFNPETKIHTEIKYDIPFDVHVTLKIFNLLGQEVRPLMDATQQASSYTVLWDGKDSLGKNASSGVYFCRLQAGDFAKTIKIVLLR